MNGMGWGKNNQANKCGRRCYIRCTIGTHACLPTDRPNSTLVGAQATMTSGSAYGSPRARRTDLTTNRRMLL